MGRGPSPRAAHKYCGKIGSNLWLLLAAAAAPEVYTVIPPQPLEKKPGQLEQWQLEQFFDRGFVQVNNFFTKEELQPVLRVSQCYLPMK